MSDAAVPVTLPRLHWGDPTSTRRALLVHGLGSSAHTMWELGEGLAAAGWSATAVDLRGHGDAPRASRYRIADFAADLAATTPLDGRATWDAVLAHSIGGASAIVAAATAPHWTERLVLLDPAVRADEQLRQLILTNQLSARQLQSAAQVADENPHWHPLTAELRVRAVQAASWFALEHAVLDNPDWDASEEAARLRMPTLVIAGDPARGGMFAGEHGDSLLATNPRLSSVAIDAGHNVHRDAPAVVLEHVLRFLG